MFALLLRIVWPLALFQCIQARVALFPKFYGQDSAIIVDTDRKLPSKMDSKLQNALYYNIPIYKMIKPVTPTTTSTTPAPITDYPSDLLYIARQKLGLKELPTITELGELLGTGSAQETIDYIRSLTSNEQGIALMKDYLESLDYGQEEEAPTEDDADNEEEDNDLDNADTDTDYEVMPKKISSSSSTSTTQAPSLPLEDSLMQRFGAFMKQYNLWSESTTQAPIPITTQKPSPPSVSFKPVFLAPGMRMRPLLVRQPLPYHYPIPLRPVKGSSTSTTTTTTTPRPTPSPHLNTPKHQEQDISSPPVAPHVQQLAEMANISPLILDRFLQQQPKLAELAQRVSRLPISQEHSKTIDSQVFVAVKKALSQNEELKRLLSAAQTLK